LAWGEIEADFQRYYSIDVNRAVFKENMSHRRFMNLLSALPYESSFAFFLRDKENRNAVAPSINI